MSHCPTCTCADEQPKTVMHKKHTYKDTPSYIMTDREGRRAVYLCQTWIKEKQNCGKVKEVTL